MKKIVSYLLFAALLGGAVLLFSSPAQADPEISEVFPHSNGTLAFGILYDEILEDASSAPLDRTLLALFRDNYGGAYLDDNGVLTVFYKSEAKEAALAVKAYLDEKTSSDVPFRAVQHSYNNLLELQETFCKLVNSPESPISDVLAKKIQSVGISQRYNCLRLSTEELSTDEVATIQRALSSFPLMIEEYCSGMYLY